jgi:predicted nucleotidyltransferase
MLFDGRQVLFPADPFDFSRRNSSFPLVFICSRKTTMITRQQALNRLQRFKDEDGPKYGIVSLGIFGSLARNQATNKSDVDVVIETLNTDAFQIVHLKEDLEKLDTNPIMLNHSQARYFPSKNYLSLRFRARDLFATQCLSTTKPEHVLQKETKKTKQCRIIFSQNN